MIFYRRREISAHTLFHLFFLICHRRRVQVTSKKGRAATESVFCARTHISLSTCCDRHHYDGGNSERSTTSVNSSTRVVTADNRTHGRGCTRGDNTQDTPTHKHTRRNTAMRKNEMSNSREKLSSIGTWTMGPKQRTVQVVAATSNLFFFSLNLPLTFKTLCES